MKRLLTALIASTACNFASGQSVYCPAADTDMNQDGMDDIGLLLVTADTTTSGRSGEEVEIVLPADLSADSTCRIDAFFTAYDPDGEAVYSGDGTIDGPGFLVWQRSQYGTPLRLSFRGRATGCTMDELPTTVAINHLKSKQSDGSCIDDGCYELLTSEQQRIIYGRELGEPEEIARDGGDRRYKIVDNYCPAMTQVERSGESAGSFEPVWDIDDITTSQSSNAETELVIIVTPPLLTPACPETSSLYRTSIRVTFRYEAIDKNGNRIEDTIELDSETMIELAAVLLANRFPAKGAQQRNQGIVLRRDTARLMPVQSFHVIDEAVRIQRLREECRFFRHAHFKTPAGNKRSRTNGDAEKEEGRRDARNSQNTHSLPHHVTKRTRSNRVAASIARTVCAATRCAQNPGIHRNQPNSTALTAFPEIPSSPFRR